MATSLQKYFTSCLRKFRIKRKYQKIGVKDSVIVKLPKRGNLADCDNWRGITLIPVIMKIFGSAIINRIRVGVDNKAPVALTAEAVYLRLKLSKFCHRVTWLNATFIFQPAE